MTTRELVNALRGLYVTVDYVKYIEPGLNFESLSKAAERLEELEKELDTLKNTKKPKPEWTSVEERLPKSGFVLCTDGKYCFMNIIPDMEDAIEDGVTHWMPLPEPPKPKESTFKDVFLEKFPKADIEDGDDGNSPVCRNAVFFGSALCSPFPICSECWNQPYFEEEGEGDA